MKNFSAPYRYPLMLLALLALLAALWAGLLRIGWNWPPLRPLLPLAHGPLMASGFLGTLIGLERAVAMGKRWAYASPLLTGLGALALLAPVPREMGPLLIALGSLVQVIVMAVLIRRHRALFLVTIGLGAVAWLVGNLVWLSDQPVAQAVPWWAGFLILTIAGERLELNRVLPLSGAARTACQAVIGLFIGGLAVSLADFQLGVRLAGVAMVGLALWLLRYDIARRRLREQGQARFMAISLLSGYLWLGVGGILAVRYGGIMAGPHYDAVLHAVFLGHVFAMIFAHAMMILPAVLGRAIAYSPRFYGHLVLLNLSLILRLAGDLLPWWSGRRWGGLLNAVALLLFLVNTALSARSAHNEERRR